METSKMNKKQFVIFMCIAFGLGWILHIIGSVMANNGNQMGYTVAITISMYMPFLGVLIAKVPLKGMGWKPHLKGKLRYVFFALWMPAILSTLGGCLFFAIFPNVFDSKFETMYGMMERAGTIEQFEEMGISMEMCMLGLVIMSVTYVPFVNMLAALGEEVGWRGALYPYLKERLGVTKGRIAGGLIWGVWHWLIMILAGYEYGKEYIGAPVLGPIVFCIFTVVMGIFYDFVYEKTETIWLPSLLHGATNAFTVFAFLTKPEYSQTLQPQYSKLGLLGPTYLGIISMIPLIIAAVIICVKKEKEVAVEG